MYRQRKNRKRYKLATTILALIVVIAGYVTYNENGVNSVKPGEIPKWDGRSAYVSVDNGKPDFSDSELKTVKFERHDRLDAFGKSCGNTGLFG